MTGLRFNSVIMTFWVVPVYPLLAPWHCDEGLWHPSELSGLRLRHGDIQGALALVMFSMNLPYRLRCSVTSILRYIAVNNNCEIVNRSKFYIGRLSNMTFKLIN